MLRLKYTLLCGTSALSEYETPRYLAAIHSDELPLTSTGKVQRTVLRKNLERERFSSVYDLLQTSQYRFSVLSPHSKLVSDSHALYNHCWQPLSLSLQKYTNHIGKHTILMAQDQEGKIAGQIAFTRTDLSAQELLTTTYADLLTSHVVSPHGKAFVCISICSADFKPK